MDRHGKSCARAAPMDHKSEQDSFIHIGLTWEVSYLARKLGVDWCFAVLLLAGKSRQIGSERELKDERTPSPHCTLASWPTSASMVDRKT